MSKTVQGRTFRIDGNITCLTPEDRDKVCMQKYGMTFEEWQKANPPMSDEERHKMIMENIK